MMIRKIIFVVDGREVCSYMGTPPPEGRLIHLEERVAGISGRFRVGDVVEMWGSSDSHVSITAMTVGGVFQVTPGPVEVHLHQASG